MRGTYEAEGVLEGGRFIRLKEPVLCGEGPVKVSITPLDRPGEIRTSNRIALAALERLLSASDDLPPSQWEELDRIVREHPFRLGTSTSK